MKLDIVQVAYHVTDIKRAALQMHEEFGAGPFFLNENITLAWGEHRGEPTDFVHSSAYGQWGSIMVECFTQENEANSPYRDMYGPTEEGLHHTAIMVEDMDKAIKHFESRDMPLVTSCGFSPRVAAGEGAVADFAFIDETESLGHMIEIYPKSKGLQDFYRMIFDSSQNWSGENPVRLINRGRP